MKLTIDIPELKWVSIQNEEYCGILDDSLYRAIKNGTPIPEGEWIDDFCPKCGVSKYNFFTVIKGANGERTKPFGTWSYCPKCGADLRGKKVEGDVE